MLAGKGVILGEISTMRAKTWYKKAKDLLGGNDTIKDWILGDKITEEELEKTLLGKDILYATWATSNPRCPVSAMAKLLRRYKKDMISKEVINNPNCPKKEKELWYLNTIDAPKNTFFLSFYNEKDPEIEMDEEIREAIKDKLLTYIFKVYKPLKNLWNPTIINSRIRTLLNEFSDDFEVSIVIDELDKQQEK